MMDLFFLQISPDHYDGFIFPADLTWPRRFISLGISYNSVDLTWPWQEIYFLRISPDQDDEFISCGSHLTQTTDLFSADLT